MEQETRKTLVLIEWYYRFHFLLRGHSPQQSNRDQGLRFIQYALPSRCGADWEWEKASHRYKLVRFLTWKDWHHRVSSDTRRWLYLLLWRSRCRTPARATPKILPWLSETFFRLSGALLYAVRLVVGSLPWVYCNQLLHEIGGTQALTLGRGVIRNCRVALGFWYDLGYSFVGTSSLFTRCRFLVLERSCSVVWCSVTVSTVAVVNPHVRRCRAVHGFASRPIPPSLTKEVAGIHSIVWYLDNQSLLPVCSRYRNQ